MRMLIAIVVALFAAVGLGYVLIKDEYAGYVLIREAGWTIEMNFVLFVVILLLVFLLLHFLVRLIGSLLRAPRKVKTGLDKHRQRRSQDLLARGTKELIEGRWSAAEVSFMKSVAHSRVPALHYAGAAQAAQRLSQPMRRDGYLRRAADMPERDALALELVQAEIMIEEGRLTDARDLLQRLHRQHPTNARTLELLATLYRDLGQWSELKDLMPRAEKNKALAKSHQAGLQRDMYRALLNEAGRRGALEELHALWGEMPEALRQDEALLIDYVGHLRDSNAAGEAETLLRGALQRQWSDKLVVGYGEIGRGDSVAQLQSAESWFARHPDNPYLLLTLGRLAKRCRQNDKARKYLEQSVAVMPMPDAYQELGELLDEMNQGEAAKLCYRLGLRLASGRPEEKEGGELLPAEAAGGKPAAVEDQSKHPVPAAAPATSKSRTSPPEDSEPAKAG